jgi:hypothetical protein
MDENSILCYSVAVKKRLQAITLTQALNQLISYNEMLQVRLEDGRYVPETETHELQRNEPVSIYDCAGKSAADVETMIGQTIVGIAGRMRCKRGESVRALYFNLDNDFSKLLLLAHRTAVDQRGLVLILEDLYRIYEQLSNGREIALRRVHKSYTEFIEEAAATRRAELISFGDQSLPDPGKSISNDSGGETQAERRKTAVFSIVLDETFKRQLFSWQLSEFGLPHVEALAGGVLRSLAKAGEGDSVRICVKSDYRFADERLMRTVGAMMRTYILPSDFAKERELFSDIKKLRRTLRDIPLCCMPPDSDSLNAGRCLLLNLEYLTCEPWLGGDEWQPEGFIMLEKGRLRENYAIEIVPSIFSDRIEIVVRYQEAPDIKVLVDKFAANLVPELEIILRYCKGYVGAKEFWVSEFVKPAAQLKIEVESDGHPVIEGGRATWECKVEKSVIDRALLSAEADESQLLLAAYGILASRLCGREDLVLLCAFDREGVSTVFPLRLNPVWTSSFKLFVEQAKEKLRRAVAVGQYAFDILIEEQPKHCRPYPVLDIGYFYKQRSGEKSVERPSISQVAGYQLFNQEPDLALEVSGCDGDHDICFSYETSRFSAGIIKRFGDYLNAILEDVAADANVKLGDIEFERDRKVFDKASILAQDAFNF